MVLAGLVALAGLITAVHRRVVGGLQDVKSRLAELTSRTEGRQIRLDERLDHLASLAARTEAQTQVISAVVAELARQLGHRVDLAEQIATDLRAGRAADGDGGDG